MESPRIFNFAEEREKRTLITLAEQTINKFEIVEAIKQRSVIEGFQKVISASSDDVLLKHMKNYRDKTFSVDPTYAYVMCQEYLSRQDKN